MYVTLYRAPEVTTFTLRGIVITPPLLFLLELVVHQISSSSSNHSFLRLYNSKAPNTTGQQERRANKQVNESAVRRRMMNVADPYQDYLDVYIASSGQPRTHTNILHAI